MAEEEGTWLSPESFKKLQAELEEMTTVKRAEIAEKIEAARSEGDLRENGGYQAAREEQSKLEGRIAELRHLLETAKVSEPPSADEVAAGTIVTAKIAGDTERFLIASREVLNLVDDLEVYPENAPMGKAIIGLKPGESTSFKAPNGKNIDVEIVKIEAFEG
ncbi:MAG: transcription elongation factor GreA [Actinomycetaceae bacterium]|nr:transcription elongation factor GreA [Actinomycetaceae bacterium]